MGTRYQDHMDEEFDALRPAWVKLGEALILSAVGTVYIGTLAAQVIWLANQLGVGQ